MNLTIKKNEIKQEIDKIEDEKLLWAIARLLHLDDEGEAPEMHKNIVKEREVKYGKSTMKGREEIKRKELNPMTSAEFYARNAQSQKEIKEGKLLTQEEVKRKLGIRK